MKSPLLSSAILIAALMIISASVVYVLRPTVKLAERVGQPDLERTIPKTFGQWAMEANQPISVINPVQEENINRIYDRTLSRNYVGPNGYRIMLSIAYGADQRSGIAMSVHYPEVCYPAQGFEVRSNTVGSIFIEQAPIPVRRLETIQGNRRVEPITYWILLGSRLTLGGLDRRIIELEYGLAQEIPDGLLFRVSSIDADSQRAFNFHEQFIKELLHDIPAKSRTRLIGTEFP